MPAMSCDRNGRRSENLQEPQPGAGCGTARGNCGATGRAAALGLVAGLAEVGGGLQHGSVVGMENDD